MHDRTINLEQKVKNTSMGRSHVVILGAGASVAAFPNGDKNGRRLPLMSDLIEKLNLEREFKDLDLELKTQNFETIYRRLHGDPKQQDLITFIDESISEYFSILRLPDEPTLYDHLLLSLRPKDVVATFNWDPFLFDACVRNHQSTFLPHCIYLHGNVRVGYCLKDKRKGYVNAKCSQCGEAFTPSKLLYPIEHKNYSDDEFISKEWADLKMALENAYVVTIFGYSAPTTDSEAVDLMKAAWGEKHSRNLEEIEVIDLKNEDQLLETWNPFIHTHHYQFKSDFYDSILAKHPRRSCEATWNQLMDVMWVEEHDFPIKVKFPELRKWFNPLLEVERESMST